jgi:hypothetical protein
MSSTRKKNHIRRILLLSATIDEFIGLNGRAKKN